MNWIDALKIAGPLVISLVPAAAPFSGLILKGIEVAEEFSADGQTKKANAINIVKLGGQVANTATKTNAFNPDEMGAVAASVIDQVVTATNELHRQSKQ